MSQDKEREIQLQFLEEAQEYLDTIESVLLGLASSHIDAQQMDAVLRAAHSVKGGAGMMGFGTLSQLAHRLEDSFKVMKAQRNSIRIDGELESLLLGAVDRLRHVLLHSRQGTDVDEQWLVTVGNPVFENLHQRLGDPVADDAATMLGSEDGTNVAALLFETEVEGCLNRLEAVLADPQAPCLEEELSIMAQELGGLGEMLQLPAFTQLCESVIQHLETEPHQVRETARSALNAWRRSQALVLVGQVSSLPTSIDGVKAAGAYVTQPRSSPTPTLAVEENWQYEGVAAEFDITAHEESPTLPSSTSDEFTEERVSPTALSASGSLEVQTRSPTIKDVPAEHLYAVEENDYGEVVAAEFDLSAHEESPRSPEVTREEETEERVSPTALSTSLSREVLPDLGEVQTADYHAYGAPEGASRRREVKPSPAGGTQPSESQENSVRIPVRQLDRLNDLFGELTIERNGLSLQLGRLRNLIETLSRRVSTLEQSNKSLRTAYDKVATQSADRTAPRSLMAFNASNDQENALFRPSYNTYGHNSVVPLHAFNADVAGPDSVLGDSAKEFRSGFDALEMDRYSDLHLLSQEVMETIVQIQEVTSDIGLSLEDTDQTARELNQTAKQLQTNLTRIRMRPLSELVGRFSRALRDLSLQYGKLVELKVLGSGTLIDRSILEALSDPLMHLVRNAFDHGIEDPATRIPQGKPPKGVIEIKAAHRGNQTIITVSDDGKGINLNKIRAKAEAMGLDAELLAAASEDELLSLIFEPGFSTADQVTDLSGRGVGMDVVRNNLSSIRGDIRVDTQPGRGTTFTLTVPFTLSVARVLLVESNGMLLAFPTDVIEEMLLLIPEQVLTTPGSVVLNWEGEMVPLIRLGAWLKFSCPRRATTPEGVPTISEPTVLMISQGDQLVGMQVDRCWGEREVAIRQVTGPLVMPPGFASCTILGDGKVVPLVDATSLLRWIASSDRPESRDVINHDKSCDPPTKKPLLSTAYKDNPPAEAIPQSQKDTILVVDDSINVRRFLALALEKAGYLVEQAKDGQDAVEKLLGGCKVEAVICDIEMPRLDGYGFLARIKSDPAYERLPIAMLTSRSGDKHRQLAMTLGAAAYFSKPYNERELLRIMRQLITESQARKPIHAGVG
ncbi:MAG TPA: response regulator [Candidatus Obscuribacterales bacterium]|jgi:chemosensory pili system protein ChpA (sensor histidine kinase/response regulator)